MGGYGSGEHFRNANYRYTVEDCLSIKISQLQIRNLINEPDSENYFSILKFYKDRNLKIKSFCYIIHNHSQIYTDPSLLLDNSYGCSMIQLTYQPAGEHRYGGKRLLMQCPNCGHTILKLFLKPPFYKRWLCRICHDLTHSSSKESSKPNMFHSMIAARLGVTAEFVHKTINSGRYRGRLNNYTIEKIIKEKPYMKQVGFKLSTKQIKELETLSREYGLSKSELIRRSFDHYIDYLKMRKAKINALTAKNTN